MGEVIAMRRKVAAKDEETQAALWEMKAQTDRGELHGSMHITETDEGTRFYALGAYKERMQMGVLSMVRCLNHLVEEIAASGTAGTTKAIEPIDVRVNFKRTMLPKRLREATGFGELE
jgi:hypothetical protein